MKNLSEKYQDRHIRIDSVSLLEQIDEIRKSPEYKSFNKVINEALFYGLPILKQKLFGNDQEEDPIEDPAPNNAPYDNCPDNEFCWNVAVLLREINGYELLIKKMISGISQVVSLLLEFWKYDEIANVSDSGKLNVIPECLEKEETEFLKRLTALNKKAERR